MSPLKITMVQTDLVWEDPAANLSLLEKKLDRELVGHVVILPEMFPTGFSMQPEQFGESMDGTTMQWMRRMAVERKAIICGSFIAEEEGRYFNRLVWMQPDGRFGYYDKRHLFAFAGEDQHYSGGAKRLVASVNGWRINLMVCYDLRFPVWSRQQFDEDGNFEYDVLLYVANWPERRRHAWKTLLQARAIENQAFVIGLNRVGNDGNGIYHSGDSMLVDPLGEVLYHKENEEDVFATTLDPVHLLQVREKFQFWRDADRFTIEP